MIKFRLIALCLITVLVLPILLSAQEIKTGALPQPEFNGKNSSLLKLLEKRRSHRQFGSEEISRQQLSELLWAANGINDSASGKRTVPSAYNWHGVSVYAALPTGLFLYEPERHSLTIVSEKDLRAYTGSQDFVKRAPLNLIYVADFSKMSPVSKTMTDEKRLFLSALETGCMVQNVYLYCASEGLNAVVRDMVDREELAKQMEVLKPEQKIIIVQTVGYPD